VHCTFTNHGVIYKFQSVIIFLILITINDFLFELLYLYYRRNQELLALNIQINRAACTLAEYKTVLDITDQFLSY